MKTIFDAVNELKGDLGNTTGGHNKLTEFILAFRCIDSKYFAFNNSRGLSECFQYICTVEQFNALVEEMKLGLDVNEITERMFHCYKYNAKELLKPEPIKQASNTYTQEMADNGVFPSVGMECQTSTGIITVKYVGKKVVVCEDSDGDEYTTSKKSALHSFKPLTPPVPLIDGKAYQFINEGATIEQGIYYDGMLINQHGSTALILCTNTQPLTLAGE